MNPDPDIWSPVDCDGLEPPSKPSIIAHIPLDLRSVDVLDGAGRRGGRLLTSAASKPISMDLTFEEEIPISGPLPTDATIDFGYDVSLRFSTTQTRAFDAVDRVDPRAPIFHPFTDTPGPKGGGSKSGVQVEVPAEGWPEGWDAIPRQEFARHGRSLSNWTNDPTAIGWGVVLPNTEPGRIAAWVLEAK